MTTECLLSVVVREILFTSRVVVVVIVVNLGPLLTPPPSKTSPFEQNLKNGPEFLLVFLDLLLYSQILYS